MRKNAIHHYNRVRNHLGMSAVLVRVSGWHLQIEHALETQVTKTEMTSKTRPSMPRETRRPLSMGCMEWPAVAEQIQQPPQASANCSLWESFSTRMPQDWTVAPTTPTPVLDLDPSSPQI